MLSGGTIIETLEITSAKGEFVSFRTLYQFPHESLTTHSTLRFPSRQQVESLVARSGLAVRQVFGDWDGSSFEQTGSREIIFVAEIADEASRIRGCSHSLRKGLN